MPLSWRVKKEERDAKVAELQAQGFSLIEDPFKKKPYSYGRT
jgi:hypothetical protein